MNFIFIEKCITYLNKNADVTIEVLQKPLALKY